MISLECKNLDITIGKTTVCQGLSLRMNPGEAWVILGKNGSGKTTLLHTLAGLRPADSGEIHIQERLLSDYTRLQVAQRLGVLFQQDDESFPATVLESTLIGRHPYLSWMQWENSNDIKIAENALDTMGLLEFKDRDIHSLSGGERRRVRIACLLTQNPDIALLDEPDNYLDIHHQIETLKILQEQFKNKLLLMSAHDINLANRFCTHALMLFGDGKSLHGKINEVITASNLERLYGIRINKIRHDNRDLYFPQ